MSQWNITCSSKRVEFESQPLNETFYHNRLLCTVSVPSLMLPITVRELGDQLQSQSTWAYREIPGVIGVVIRNKGRRGDDCLIAIFGFWGPGDGKDVDSECMPCEQPQCVQSRNFQRETSTLLLRLFQHIPS